MVTKPKLNRFKID